MEYYIYKTDDELVHWGIKGMKWGIRRYQNKDGSLTNAGKQRRAAEEAKLAERERSIKNRERVKADRAKLAAKKAELDAREKALRSKKSPAPNKTAKPAQQPPTTKSIKDLNDTDLRAEINRLRLEKEYYDARNNLAAANPKQVSMGKRFINSLAKDVVIPAAKTVGKEYLEKKLKNALGLNDKSAKSLMPEVKTWDDMKKKQEWESANRKEAAERQKEKDDAAAAKKKLDDVAAANKKAQQEIKAANKKLEQERKQLEAERKKFEEERDKRTEQGDS